MRSQIGNNPAPALASGVGGPESGHMTDTDQMTNLHDVAREA